MYRITHVFKCHRAGADKLFPFHSERVLFQCASFYKVLTFHYGSTYQSIFNNLLRGYL